MKLVVRPLGAAGRSRLSAPARAAGLDVAAAPAADTSIAYRDSRLIFGLALLFVAIMPFAPAFQWHPGVFVDPGDLLMLPMLVVLARLAVPHADEGPTWWQELPCRGLWCLYGVLAAMAYARWSYEAGFLGGGALYQFYRYCWKPMLFYPVTFYLAGRPGGIQWVVAAFVVSTDFNAMAAIAQGRSGVDVRGVMSLFHKNMLAGSFLVPLFLALGDSMHNPARPWRVAARVSTLLIAAGLWYAVSRGAIVGALAGLAAYVCLSPKGWRFAAAGLALIAILAVVRPDFGASSGIMERFTDIGHGAESENLAWRMHERWPHFIDIVEHHPLLGVGQAADYSLGADTNTPHNGYLALMVQSGIPATVCYVLILVMIAVRAMSLARARLPDRVRGWAAVGLAGLVAFCVHNFVDSTFESGAAAYSIWVLCGIVMGLSVQQRSRDRSPARDTRPGARGTLKRGSVKRSSVAAA